MRRKSIVGKSIPLLVCMLIAISCGKKNKSKQGTTEMQDKNLQEEKLVMQAIYKSKIGGVEKQKFKISTDSIGFIIGKKGAVVGIQPGSFLDENGKPVKGEVEVHLGEVVSMQDFIQSGISTVERDKILETGGTYFIQATQNGKELQINPQVGISLSVPTVAKQPNMQLFYGEAIKDSLNPNGVNWTLPQQPNSNLGEPIEPLPPKDVLDPLEGLEKNEAALDAEYMRAEAFIKGIDAQFRLEGDKYVFEGSNGRRITYDVSYVNRLRRKLNALKEYKKFLDQKRNYYRKKNAALYQAWDNYKRYAQAYGIKFNSKPSFYEAKLLKQRAYWFNIDRYKNETLVTYKLKIIREKTKRIAVFARVHIVSEEDKVHVQEFLNENSMGTVTFKFPKNKQFKVVIESSLSEKDIKEFIFDGKQTDLGEVMV